VKTNLFLLFVINQQGARIEEQFYAFYACMKVANQEGQSLGLGSASIQKHDGTS
jgi:hypothetical protein